MLLIFSYFLLTSIRRLTVYPHRHYCMIASLLGKQSFCLLLRIFDLRDVRKSSLPSSLAVRDPQLYKCMRCCHSSVILLATSIQGPDKHRQSFAYQTIHRRLRPGLCLVYSSRKDQVHRHLENSQSFAKILPKPSSHSAH